MKEEVCLLYYFESNDIIDIGVHFLGTLACWLYITLGIIRVLFVFRVRVL